VGRLVLWSAQFTSEHGALHKSWLHCGWEREQLEWGLYTLSEDILCISSGFHGLRGMCICDKVPVGGGMSSCGKLL